MKEVNYRVQLDKRRELIPDLENWLLESGGYDRTPTNFRISADTWQAWVDDYNARNRKKRAAKQAKAEASAAAKEVKKEPAKQVNKPAKSLSVKEAFAAFASEPDNKPVEDKKPSKPVFNDPKPAQSRQSEFIDETTRFNRSKKGSRLQYNPWIDFHEVAKAKQFEYTPPRIHYRNYEGDIKFSKPNDAAIAMDKDLVDLVGQYFLKSRVGATNKLHPSRRAILEAIIIDQMDWSERDYTMYYLAQINARATKTALRKYGKADFNPAKYITEDVTEGTRRNTEPDCQFYWAMIVAGPVSSKPPWREIEANQAILMQLVATQLAVNNIDTNQLLGNQTQKVLAEVEKYRGEIDHNFKTKQKTRNR